VLGASGYTGAELLRLIAGHPDLELAYASAETQAGTRAAELYPSLAAELDTPDKRRRYIATFYTSRYWAHPDHFSPADVDYMTEPFADGRKLRASWGAYESAFSESARSEEALVRFPNPTHALILFGPSDHVIYPEFDKMAAAVFPDHVGPFLVRDAGHFLQWEAADVFNSAVRAFCRDLL
jgi:pimeloyl-ACP methyl ester carboxylesterase